MPGEMVAERRMYLPLAGVLSISVIGGYALLRRAAERRTRAPSTDATADPTPAPSAPMPPALWWCGRAVVATAVIACFAGTLRRNSDYRTAVSILTDTLAKRPNNVRAWNNLGTAYIAARRLDRAAECFAQAVELGGNAEAPGNLGLVLCDLGRHAEALPHLLVSLQVRDKNPWGVHYNVGVAFLGQGRLEEAAEQLAEAARLAPEQPTARAAYGHALIRLGRTEQGLAETREAHRLRPAWPAPLSQLAWVLSTHPEARYRDAAEAVRLAERARELTGGKDPTVLNVLAAAYAEAGRSDDAVRAGLKAEELANNAGRSAMARDIRRRVDAFYRAGRPFRESAAVVPPPAAGEQREARITEP
jgi:tetratricopeptide (TPR) repeat protein